MTHVSTDFRRFCKPQDTGASCRVEYVVNPCLLDVGNGVGLDKLNEIQRERRIERNGVIIRNYKTTSTSNTVLPY